MPTGSIIAHSSTLEFSTLIWNMIMASRGALYVYWGTKYKSYLDRSIASLKKFHPDLPVHVETLPDESTLLDKARMAEMTPFDETLFLDVDTVVMGPLDFGFERAAQFGLACSICECPWARRYGGLKGRGDMVEYNTGVLFFTQQARPLFDAWAACVDEIDSSIRFINEGQVYVMPLNDQAGFAGAVVETGCSPYVLPYNWNFRPEHHLSFFGPIKIWHAYPDPPADMVRMNEYYATPDPIIQFAWTAKPQTGR